MKKTTRSLLISALILFCTGLLVAIGTTLYAKIAKIEVYDIKEKARTIENLSVTIDEILSHSPESNYVKQVSQSKFTRIDLSSYAGNVVLKVEDGDPTLVLDKTNTNNLTYSVVGDTLVVSEVDPVGFMGFYMDKGGISFKGLRHTFHPGNAVNGEKTITIKVPATFPLTQVDIFSAFGDVTIDGVSVSTLNVEADCGNVNVKNLTNPDGKVSIEGNFTDVEMDKNHYSNCVISTHFGNIKTSLLENTNASTILDLWCGKTEVKTAPPTTHYKLSLVTTIGSISRNGKEVGKKLNSDGSGAARISSSIFLGDFILESELREKEPVEPELAPSDNANAPAEVPETTSEQSAS